MISYEAYKLIHIFGILLLIFSLGRLCLQPTDDRARVSGRERKLLGLTHGAAVLIILVAGFGLLARLSISHAVTWPWWVWAKIGIWVLLGVTPLVIRKSVTLTRSLWLAVPILGAVAAYLAIYKPL
jgi:uncharacterized membrane protein